MYQFETLHSAKTLLFLKIQFSAAMHFTETGILENWIDLVSQNFTAKNNIYIIYEYAHLNFSLQMGPIGHKMTHHGLTMRESPKMFFFRKNYKIGDPSLTVGPNLKSDFSCKK